MACTSHLPGDSLLKKCSSFCSPNKGSAHCKWCKCSACSFCSERQQLPAVRNTPQQQRRPEFSQLVRGADVQQTTRSLNEQWANGGVAVRLLECSMGCTNHLSWDFKKGRGGALRMHVSERECIELEMKRRDRPASVLRWDLPLAIFNGGRCVSPAPYERTQHLPEATAITTDGFITNGFIGHNVTSSGIGWVLGDVPRRRRGGAFGHDAWTFNYKLSGTGDPEAKLHERAALHQCTESDGQSNKVYAETRMASRRRPFGYAPGSLHQLAASYKWGLVNTSWNCYHGHRDWEGAFADQRAFAMLLAAKQETLADECSIWGSLYNQVHLSWNASDIRAIFFVNDTLSARRAATQRASSREVGLLADGARSAAQRAYADALITQHALLNRTGRLIPVVQYTVTPECFDGRPLAQRMAGQRNSYKEVFQVPESALRELSTLLDLKVHHGKKKKRKPKPTS